MNELAKSNLRKMGFDKELKRIELNLCPFCGMPVKQEDFRNALSRKEFTISNLCQKCQDEFFDKE